MNMWLKYFLIFAIIVGIFLRFYSLNSYIFGDEILLAVSGLKMHHQGFENGVRMSYIHPPVGQFFNGLLTSSGSNYESLKLINDEPPIWTYLYYAHAPLKDNYVSMRVMSAFFGTLAILFIFLITKKVFGFEAGLFSAALVSLSADFIFFSRVTLNEIFMIFFMVATIYFYLKYLDSFGRKKYLFLILTFLFLFLALGSRILQPLILIPFLVLSQILFKWDKKKEILILLAIVGIAYFLIFGIIFKPSKEAFAGGFEKALKISSLFDIFGNSFKKLLEDIVFRNSYFDLFAILSAIIFSVRFLIGRTFSFKSLVKNKGLSVLIILFFISFTSLGLSKYGDIEKSPFQGKFFDFTSRYSIVIFIPIFLLGGVALQKYSKGVLFSLILIAIILFDIYNITNLLPDNLYKYSNFDFGCCLLHGTKIEDYEAAKVFLNSVENPIILTNSINALVFYNSASGFPTNDLIADRSLDPRCHTELIKSLANQNLYIVYELTRVEVGGFLDDTRFCEHFNLLDVKEVFSHGDIRILKIGDLNQDILKLDVKNLTDFLDASGNPPFLTNDYVLMLNLLAHYKKIKPDFTQENLDCRSVESLKKFFIVYEIKEPIKDIRYDPNVKDHCPLLLGPSLTELKDFVIDEKKVIIYKVN